MVSQLDAENDRAISEHVLRGHRFRKPGSDMEPEQLNGTSAEGAGQQEQTESPEEAAQVMPDSQTPQVLLRGHRNHTLSCDVVGVE